jgi:hypothetical protein
MEHQIPQFIEVEDKVIGPFSIKQFIYIGGSLGLGFLLWSILPKVIAFFIALPIMGLGFGLAFYKHNGRPLVVTLENAFHFISSTKLYIWKKEEKKPVKGKRAEETVAEEKIYVPRLSTSKLRELTWSLDINERK